MTHKLLASINIWEMLNCLIVVVITIGKKIIREVAHLLRVPEPQHKSVKSLHQGAFVFFVNGEHLGDLLVHGPSR